MIFHFKATYTGYLSSKQKEKAKAAVVVYLTTLASSSLFSKIAVTTKPTDFGYAAILAIFPALAAFLVSKVHTD